jgi:8-hydroxy-5-deazaflavin:NADPH oxidoreductase
MFESIKDHPICFATLISRASPSIQIMRIGIIGTGIVGSTLGTKLVELGYDVKMGSRTSNNEKAAEWVRKAGSKASQGTFADAASFGEILFNCTSGNVSVEALKMAGAENLKRKVLVDVANSLDFSRGMPPTLTILNTDSVGEQIQRAFPEAKVVKSLNTVSAPVMVNPMIVPGEHDVFVAGNDSEAKAHVQKILGEFGWKSIIDLGDISTSRGTEMWLALWVRLMMKYQNPMFNLHIHKQG